jgi:DNA-binding SARP family transcriptional activator
LFEGDVVDVDEFDSAVELALAERGDGRLALLQRVDRLWTGEPLPEDRYEDWAIPWRGRLADRFLGVLVALAREHTARGDDPGAIHALQRIVELDPVYEGAHRDLMSAYARTGRPGHALRQYLECRRAMSDELGVEPSQETSRLQAQILAGEGV